MLDADAPAVHISHLRPPPGTPPRRERHPRCSLALVAQGQLVYTAPPQHSMLLAGPHRPYRPYMYRRLQLICLVTEGQRAAPPAPSPRWERGIPVTFDSNSIDQEIAIINNDSIEYSRLRVFAREGRAINSFQFAIAPRGEN